MHSLKQEFIECLILLEKIMGNIEEKPHRELIILETSITRQLQKEIIELLSQKFTPIFMTLEEISKKVQSSENTHNLIAEQSYKKSLQQLLAGHPNIICSYIKVPPQSKQFIEGVRQAARKFCSRRSNDQWKSASPQVDIKFIDRSVNSSSYEIFLNYMRNRKLSFELFETMSDFLISERRSKCSYIVVSSQYANFAFSTSAKVFCFCSKNDQIQNQANKTGFTCENNFTKIIKLILNDKQKSNPHTENTPVKTLLLWTQNMEKPLVDEISRRKVRCRIIKLSQFNQVRSQARKQLYCTIVVNGRAQRQLIENMIENSGFAGRVCLFTLKPNPEKILIRLDQHIQFGYILVPQRLKHLYFIGSNNFLQQINLLACLLHQQNIGSSFIKEQQYQVDPALGMVVVVSHDSLDRIEFSLDRLGFNSILLSIDIDVLTCTLQLSQKIDLLKKYISKMFEYIEGKIYYISKNDEVDDRLNRIIKEIGYIENERYLFVDVEFLRNQQTQINFNLKLVKFLEKQEKQIEEYWHSFARIWKLNYDPLKNLKILQADIQKSLKSLIRLKLLNINYLQLEKLYLEFFHKCHSFVSYVETFKMLYMKRLQLRLCLKNLMGSIDRYAQHQKIEAIKPLVAILMCNFSTLYSYPRIEPGVIRIYTQRSRLSTGLKVNDLVMTNQLLQYTVPAATELARRDHLSYIQIDYSESPLTPLSYYSNLITYSTHDSEAIIVSPYSLFRVISIEQSKKSTVIRLKCIQAHNPIKETIQQNTFKLQLKVSILQIFTANSGLITYSEQNEVMSRIHFHRFIWYLQQKKYLQAENRLNRCLKKINAKKMHPDFIIPAFIQLYLLTGRIFLAKEQIKKLTTQNRKNKWTKQVTQLQGKIFSEVKILRSTDLVVRQNIKRWQVSYSNQKDAFQTADISQQQVYSDTMRPLFRNLKQNEVAKKQSRNIFEMPRKVYLQVPDQQNNL